MQQEIRLALNAAAWFFVGEADDVGSHSNVPIKPPFRIGRQPDTDLCLPCVSVSGLHAEIIEEYGQLWLQDLSSTNGTFVNGTRVQSKVRLSEDDTVQFGTTVFHVTREVESDRVAEVDPESEKEVEIASPRNEQFAKLLSGDVVPFFQPIIRIAGADRTVVGYEVLGRSRLYGLRTPAQMFAAASQMEMEAELSRHLRKQGIEVADNNLPKQHALFVNTHPAELECDGLAESLFEIRDSHPHRPIVMELHESVLNDSEKIVGLRSTLQNLGIQLAFHDFGGGQIRLAELSEVSPDVVKFDIKLVQGIDKATSKRQQFVATLVRMVTDLGITPLAECIEQPGEHETLQQLGFQLGQGFLYGRPTSIADCSESVAWVPPANQSNQIPLVKSFLDDSPQEELAVATAGNESPGGSKTADWLLSQPEHHYTIQVLSAISLERAREHIAIQENPEKFAIFCKQGKTRMLYIVVYGVFEDRAAAKAASAKLTNASISPWIRILSSVHAEICADA